MQISIRSILLSIFVIIGCGQLSAQQGAIKGKVGFMAHNMLKACLSGGIASMIVWKAIAKVCEKFQISTDHSNGASNLLCPIVHSVVLSRVLAKLSAASEENESRRLERMEHDIAALKARVSACNCAQTKGVAPVPAS